MKEAIILKEHRIFFEMLDPLGFMDRTDFPDRICIGSVVEDKKSGHDVPAGLLILRVRDSKVTVEWIFVLPELRYHGIGTKLMKIAFAFAKASGAKTLEAYSCESKWRRLFCPYEKEFLTDYSFYPRSILYGEWSDGLEHIIKVAFNDRDDIGKDISIPLSKVDKALLVGIVRDASRLPGAFFSFDPVEYVELADQTVSRVIITEGKIKGLIIAQKVGEKLYITGMAASDKEYSDKLIKGVANAAHKKYGVDLEICIIKYNDSYLDVLEKYMTEPDPNFLYEADILELGEVLEEFEPLRSIYNISSVIGAEEDEEIPETFSVADLLQKSNTLGKR